MRRALVVTDSRVWTAETEYALSVAAAEASGGTEITIAAPGDGPVASAAAGRFGFEPLPGSEPARSPADFTADARFLARLVGGRGFDVVHSSRQTAHVLAALSVGRSTPLVHLRGSARAPAGHAANRFLYNSPTDAVVVSSGRIERWITERLRVPPERVVLLHAPVGDRWFGAAGRGVPVRSELGVAESDALVVCVGRLAPVKGHEVLVDAMAAVIRELPETRLVLVGEPWSGQPEGLRGRAERLGIGASVVFAGRRDDVKRFVDAADVCVSASVGSEENSRAVGEYMAAGRPVVATRVGVIPELISDGETGRLVEPGDAVAMAAALLDLLRDPETGRTLGAAARLEAESSLSSGAFRRGVESVLERVGVRGRGGEP
jgi:glycosyltransferase involved in cell wall biosynthesis